MKMWPVFLLLLVFLIPVPAQAQLTLTRNETLSFGEFVIKNFSVVGTVTVNPATGGTSSNSNIARIVNGQRGEYTVSGGPGNSTYTVTVMSSGLEPGGGGPPVLTLGSYTTFPAILQTDAGGNDTFNLGATLSTAGGGTIYNDGTYSESVDVTIEF